MKSKLILLNLLLLTNLVSTSYADFKDSEDKYSFDEIGGSYVCNKIDYIYGFDPYAKYYQTLKVDLLDPDFDKTKYNLFPEKVCRGKCTQIRQVSKNTDHILVEVDVLQQTKREREAIKKRRIELGCMGEKYACGKAWSGPINFKYKVVGNLFSGHPLQKSFNDNTCTHQGNKIFCVAEDEEITFRISKSFVDGLAEEIGVLPKSDISISFRVGGGSGYAGKSLSFQGHPEVSISKIGRFYCKKMINNR